MAGRKIDPVPLACLLTYALAPSAMLKDTLRDLALDAGPEVREIDLDLITQPLVRKALAERRADLLLYRFRQRFEPIAEGVEVKVRSAPLPDLEAWADALFDARKLDDVFRNGGAR